MAGKPPTVINVGRCCSCVRSESWMLQKHKEVIPARSPNAGRLGEEGVRSPGQRSEPQEKVWSRATGWHTWMVWLESKGCARNGGICSQATESLVCRSRVPGLYLVGPCVF